MDMANAYWKVGAELGQVYSSKKGDYVLVSDPDYAQWLTEFDPVSGQTNQLLTVDTEASLAQILSVNVLRPTPATLLDAYKGHQADEILIRTGFKVLFNHENRLRAIERQLGLNGSPPNLTAAQARAAIKGLM